MITACGMWHVASGLVQVSWVTRLAVVVVVVIVVVLPLLLVHAPVSCIFHLASEVVNVPGS